MNCREVQNLLFAEREPALDHPQRAAFDGHVAGCAACRQVRDNLADVFATWRTTTENTVSPNADQEWQAVRRRLRSEANTGAGRRHWNLFPWLAVPLGAAAALGVALFVASPTTRPTPSGPPTAPTARAIAVEAPGNNASMMVFLDDKSGWLFVWAADAPKQG